MAKASLSYRIRSLLRRIREKLNYSVRIPMMFVCCVKNWQPFFSHASNRSDTTYVLRSGLKLTVPAGTTNVNPFIEIWMNHIYDHRNLAWQNVRTAIDIGAHIGSFSLYVAQKSPQATIFAYEPDPVTASFLRKNIDQNGLRQRIKSTQAAVGGTEGTATLHVLPNRSEANSLFKSLEGSHDVTVDVTTLQKIFDENNIERCDILKMNAEGVEYEILYGLPAEYLKRIQAIVMNYHLFVQKPRCTPQELQTYLESNGFTVTEDSKRIFIAIRR